MRRAFMSTKGVVNIRGKKYRTVALRVHEFRQAFPISDGWSISTIVMEMNEHHAFVRAVIVDPSGTMVATGHAVELWGDGNVNKTSALENAETSAVGRALAAAGLGGEEYCSADELVNALKAQSIDASWTSGEEARVYPPPVVKKPKPVKENEKEEILAGLRSTAGELAEKLFNHMGGDYARWHENALRNLCGVEGDKAELENVTNVDALTIFIDGQKDKLKDLEG